MSPIFLFHGIGGHPEENWFPWLKSEVEKLGLEMVIPAFPNADHPDLSEWLEYFSKYQNQIDEKTIFIGHSLGSAFALRLLDRLPGPIRAAFLVAPVWGVMGNEYDPFMKSFTTLPYSWDHIRSNAAEFHVIQSDNDPYIKVSQSQELASHLGTEMELILGAGHFGTASGYSTFPYLLESLKRVLSRP